VACGDAQRGVDLGVRIAHLGTVSTNARRAGFQIDMGKRRQFETLTGDLGHMVPMEAWEPLHVPVIAVFAPRNQADRCF
jgi:hypothetical protein